MSHADLPSFDQPVGLFPLPNVVLFPRTTLPLQIYEPRYRVMVRDALADRSLVAMALLRPGFEPYYYTNLAEIHPVVGVGRIREHVQVSDGRYFINLLGLCRARIREEDREGEYRLALLEPLVPREGVIEADGEYAVRHSLHQILESEVFARSEGAERCRGLLASGAPVGALIDLLAAALLPGEAVEVKQCILEEVDVLRRAAILLGELQTLQQAIAAQQRQNQAWPRLGSMN